MNKITNNKGEKGDPRKKMIIKHLDAIIDSLFDGIWIMCVFRVIPAGDSGRSRPPIPDDSGHLFRTKPTTYSGAFRPPFF